MPNIAHVFREEILRVARKESRAQNLATKKAAAQRRRDVAALKRQVAELQRQVALLTRRAARAEKPAADDDDSSAAKFRFVAKGLRSHRARLGLSAGDFGRLIGASAQSVYAWESGTTVPRREQVAKIAAVRAMGKREATQRLAQPGAGERKARGGARKRKAKVRS